MHMQQQVQQQQAMQLQQQQMQRHMQQQGVPVAVRSRGLYAWLYWHSLHAQTESTPKHTRSASTPTHHPLHKVRTPESKGLQHLEMLRGVQVQQQQLQKMKQQQQQQQMQQQQQQMQAQQQQMQRQQQMQTQVSPATCVGLFSNTCSPQLSQPVAICAPAIPVADPTSRRPRPRPGWQLHPETMCSAIAQRDTVGDTCITKEIM